MERDAHYAAVGIASIALMAALAVFAIWLARLQFNNDYDVYDIVFYGPASPPGPSWSRRASPA
jgi:phospholipid/cholesterol/gamma-HCH transport system substrate-binding protein